MKYLITERQFRLLKEEGDEKPDIPKKIKVIHYEFFDKNWDKLQNYLNRNEIRKKTPYILHGDLDLIEVDVVTLGSLVGVDGSLYLTNNKTIEDLGNLQSVGGDLSLPSSNIISLGELKSVGGNLYLYNTNITSLKNIETVGGNLDLAGSKIESLENLQYVGGFLDLTETNIESLGNLESVGDYLDLRYTNIESLENLQYVKGNLFLNYSNIETLGNLKSVGDHIYMHMTPLSRTTTKEEIRNQVKVGGDIYF